MLETCPRCSARLGKPLSSGRQVCSACGWSMVVIERSPPPPPTGLHLLLSQIGRLIKRFFQYLGVQLQLLRRSLTSRSQQQQPRRNLWESLVIKLKHLEEKIPTGDPNKEWLTPEEAFQLLGGDPANPRSKVSTLDGKRRIGLSAFRRLVNTAEYADFGFQYSSDRHLKNLPYLRRLPRQP
ncbi:hypothetical protein NBE99_00175 [Thermosynechococcus sp. HN-54]|uniref:hypothetical protein n=1 Tax=Thermosynechococcus sp. HN-54 TaxID=2933959 RepID=UPI00202CD469|nr:hypothetical protein [Thermosynechococcus sp. HN-54]URR35597.1 hypothetical protein NBE99_00175 [Thermosynechococcus sp. HN-54]